MLYKNSKDPKSNNYEREDLRNLAKLRGEICLLVQIEIPKYPWKGWKYPKSGYEIHGFDTIFKILYFTRVQNIPKTTNINVNLSQM